MRVTSDIWVSALVRSAQATGDFATILRRGAREAGAIFVVHSHLDGRYSVYAPAPQSFFDADAAGERLFEEVAAAIGEAQVRDYLDRQVAFDPDCWIVELESRQPPAFVRIARP
ncbi:MAG: hypothetical protein BroJett030_32150 [Alphaproteobacteria bacterium]|nr:MAG: hypothetical protein BroJett030_32150 [Alphaproteobacteria bacterium]